MDFTKIIEFHWFSLIYSSPTSWAEDFNFTNLCTSRWAVAASGWVQRFGKLNKNINDVAKIQKITLLDEKYMIFSIFPVRCLPQSLLISYSISLILCTMLDYAEYCYHQEQYSCENHQNHFFSLESEIFWILAIAFMFLSNFPKRWTPPVAATAHLLVHKFVTLKPSTQLAGQHLDTILTVH